MQVIYDEANKVEVKLVPQEILLFNQLAKGLDKTMPELFQWFIEAGCEIIKLTTKE